jgi:hypothetical protein
MAHSNSAESGENRGPCLTLPPRYLLFFSVVGSRNHSTHFNLATFVRPAKDSNPFVAASSGVFLWRGLWQVRAKQARKKVTREK